MSINSDHTITKDEYVHTLKLKAYRYLQIRSRTVEEMRLYLTQKAKKNQQLLSSIPAVLTHLLKEKYVNDQGFIDEYVQSRIKHAPRSEFLIKRELAMKGINQQDIDTYFQKNPINEFQLAKKIFDRVDKKWNNLHPLKKKKKIHDFLARRGFSYSLIQQIYHEESKS